jgi:hypothetical protein
MVNARGWGLDWAAGLRNDEKTVEVRDNVRGRAGVEVGGWATVLRDNKGTSMAEVEEISHGRGSGGGWGQRV